MPRIIMPCHSRLSLTAGDGSTDLHLLLRDYIHPHLDQFQHLALSRKVYLLQTALDTFGKLK
jgi:hypothetical protein